MKTTTIDLMRHGEPLGGRKYRGQTDDPLSEKGWQQMWQTAAELHGWQHIVASPLVRCAAFAELLGEQRQIPVRFDARLREVGFGAWEGRTAQQLEQAEPGIVLRFKRDPVGQRPIGAEPLADFFGRVSLAWHDLLRDYSGQHLLVVCHAGVIRMALARVLGIPPENAYRIEVASASVTRIVVRGEGDEAFASVTLPGAKGGE